MKAKVTVAVCILSLIAPTYAQNSALAQFTSEEDDAFAARDFLEDIRPIVEDSILPKTPFAWLEKLFDLGVPVMINEIPELTREGMLKREDSPWKMISPVDAQTKDEELVESRFVFIRRAVKTTKTYSLFNRPIYTLKVVSPVAHLCASFPCALPSGKLPTQVFKFGKKALELYTYSETGRQITYFRKVGDLLVIKNEEYKNKSNVPIVTYTYGWRD